MYDISHNESFRRIAGAALEYYPVLHPLFSHHILMHTHFTHHRDKIVLLPTRQGNSSLFGEQFITPLTK